LAYSASRKRPWLWAVAGLAVVLVASALWYVTRPDLAASVAALRLESPPAQPESGAAKPENGAAQSESGAVQPESGTVQPESGAVEREAAPVQREADAVPLDAGPAHPDAGRTQAEIASVAEHRRQADEAEAEERARKQLEATRVAEAKRKKEEAARAAVTQNYQFAMVLLDQGRNSEAVRILRDLAYAGHGPAAKALGDLYSSGGGDVLDMQEAARFYAMAERNGVKIDRPAFVHR
jgi:hypothetical protein